MENKFLNRFPKTLKATTLNLFNRSLIKNRDIFINNVLFNNESFKKSILELDLIVDKISLINLLKQKTSDFKVDSFSVDNAIITRVYYKTNSGVNSSLNEFLIKHSIEDLRTIEKKDYAVIYKEYSSLYFGGFQNMDFGDLFDLEKLISSELHLIKEEGELYFTKQNIAYNSQLIIPDSKYKNIKLSNILTYDKNGMTLKKSTDFFQTQLKNLTDDYDLKETTIEKSLDLKTNDRTYNVTKSHFLTCPYSGLISEVSCYNTKDLFFYDISNEEFKISFHLNKNFTTFCFYSHNVNEDEVNSSINNVVYDYHFKNGQCVKVINNEKVFNFSINEKQQVKADSFIQKESGNFIVNFDASILTKEGNEVISLMTDIRKEELFSVKDSFLLFKLNIKKLMETIEKIPESDLNFSNIEKLNNSVIPEILEISSNYYNYYLRSKENNNALNGLKNGK